MIKKLHLAAMLSLAYCVATAQNTDANIYGHVLNVNTKEHIPNIDIVVKEISKRIATDKSGHYFLPDLPVGELTLIYSGVGFHTFEKKIITKNNYSIEANIELEEKEIQLDTVVVSTKSSDYSRNRSTTIINTITADRFENVNAVSLSQALNFQPGLRVETNCQNCGFQQVRMNGLEGPYAQILIDGRAIFSSLAGVYGLEQIPVNMIERVEIVRGSGSALFGSNAVAGTINIITKEPNDNTLTLSNTSNFIYGKTPDINTFINSSVISKDKKAGISLFGSIRQRKPFDYDGDDFSEIPELNNKNIGFRGFYKTGDLSKLTVEYHNLGEFRRGGNNFHLPPHEADIAEQIEHNIHTAGIKYDLHSRNKKNSFNLYTSAQQIDRKSYYGAQKDPKAYGITNDKTLVSGVQYNHNFDSVLNFNPLLSIGSELLINNMRDEMLGYHRIIEQNIQLISGFIQSEFSSKKMNISMGIRADKHNLIKNVMLSPRANIRYNIFKELNFRAAYAAGFRGPQTFDEDLHISAVGGEVLLIELDPNLQPEKSNAFTASLDYNGIIGFSPVNILIEGFYTHLNNVFVLKENGRTNEGNLLMQRTNNAGAVVKGLNFEGKIMPIPQWQIQLGFTTQKSEYKEPLKWSEDAHIQPQYKMFRTPNNYGYLSMDATIKKIKFSISGSYTGSMLIQHYKGYTQADKEHYTPAFFDLGAKLFYTFNIGSNTQLQINTGVQNIFNSYQQDFDKGALRDANYIYGPALPRTIFVGTKISI